MADRPILFSGPMVRSLLAGTKTQTRRALKPTGPYLGVVDRRVGYRGGFRWWFGAGPGELTSTEIPVRFAKGDRLWVRETFARIGFKEPEQVYYRADGESQHMGTGRESNGNVTEYFTDHWVLNGDRRKGSAWKPGIHMPRWASRLTLTVTDVRVQRLQEISEEDAIAEGSQEPSLVPIVGGCWSERQVYANLWNHINGAGSWDRNDWVIALTFTVARRNIDAGEKAAA